MGLLAVFVRLLSLVFVPAFPLAVFLWPLAGKVGLVVALATGVLAVLVALFFSERRIARASRALSHENVSGLTRSLTRSAVAAGRPSTDLPRLAVVPDPSPNVLIVRSPGRPGAVLLNRGLFSMLDEEELRAILAVCIDCCQRPQLLAASTASFLAGALLSLVPSEWVKLLFLSRSASVSGRRSVIGFVHFLMLFPWIRLLFWIGGPGPSLPKFTPATPRALINAARKIQEAGAPWSPTTSAGYGPLYLFPLSEQLSVLQLAPRR